MDATKIIKRKAIPQRVSISLNFIFITTLLLFSGVIVAQRGAL